MELRIEERKSLSEIKEDEAWVGEGAAMIVVIVVIVEVTVFESAPVKDAAITKHNERKEISMVGTIRNVQN